MTINYIYMNRYKVQKQEYKLFEISLDERWKRVDLIVETVEKHLADGLNRRKVIIKEDNPRVYL